MADNTLTLKLDADTAMPLIEKIGKDIVLPIVNEAGKSAYAIAVSHGYTGTESEWLESLRGPKGNPGDKGDPFKFSDFTPEQLNALKGKPGPPGPPGSAEQAAQLLKYKNIYIDNNQVDTVLTKLIEKLSESGYIADTTFRQLEYTQPRTGQDYIDLTGEPHFKVAVNGGEKQEFESDNMRVTIEPFGPKSIELKYYDLNENEQQTLIIRSKSTTPDQTYTAPNGVVYKKFGNDLEIDVSNYAGQSIFSFAPVGWHVDSDTQLSVNTTKKVILQFSKDSLKNDTGEQFVTQGYSIYIAKPELISFKTETPISDYLKLDVNGSYNNVRMGLGNKLYIVWDSAQNQYVNSATGTL